MSAAGEIEALFETFKDACAAGDVDKLLSIFHPLARLVGTAYEHGVASAYNKVRDEFVWDYKAQPLDSAKTYTARLDSLQILGPDTAVAVVREDYCWGDTSFIDILSLWKEQGEGWKIVHKAFTQFPTKS